MTAQEWAWCIAVGIGSALIAAIVGVVGYYVVIATMTALGILWKHSRHEEISLPATASSAARGTSLGKQLPYMVATRFRAA